MPDLLQLPPPFDDKYQYTKFVGSGSEAVVFSAIYVPTSDRVALKVLRPRGGPKLREKLQRKFLEEATILRRIGHPHVVRGYEVLDVMLDGDATIALTLEWLPGDFSKVMRKCPNGLAIGELQTYLLQAASGFEALHAESVAVRDVRPENLMLGENGLLKVGDLGMARTEENNASLQDSSRYVAPEVLSGAVRAGQREDPPPERYFPADIYSLGFIFFEAAVGSAGWEQLPVLESAYNTKGPGSGLAADARWKEWHMDMGRTLPPLAQIRRDVPREIATLLDRMVAKDASARPASMADVVRVLKGRSAPVPPPQVVPQVVNQVVVDRPTPEPPLPPPSRKPGARLLALLLLLGIAIGALLVYYLSVAPLGRQVAELRQQAIPLATGQEATRPSVARLRIHNGSSRPITITWVTAAYPRSDGSYQVFNSGYYHYPTWTVAAGETRPIGHADAWDGSFVFYSLEISFEGHTTYKSGVVTQTADGIVDVNVD